MIKINKSLLSSLKRGTRKQFKDSTGRMIYLLSTVFLSWWPAWHIWVCVWVCVCGCIVVQLPLKWGHILRRFIGYVQLRKQIYMTLNCAVLTYLTLVSHFKEQLVQHYWKI